MSYLKFIDEFHVTDFSVERDLIGKSFTWKDVKWSTQLFIKTTTAIGIFFGVENPVTMPDGFCEPLEFYYSLMTMDNIEVDSGK
jgi:hypothetical protein